jgi:hypothetical protein
MFTAKLPADPDELSISYFCGFFILEPWLLAKILGTLRPPFEFVSASPDSPILNILGAAAD